MTAEQLLTILIERLFLQTMEARTPQEESEVLGEWKMVTTAWCAVTGNPDRGQANTEIQLRFYAGAAKWAAENQPIPV